MSHSRETTTPKTVATDRAVLRYLSLVVGATQIGAGLLASGCAKPAESPESATASGGLDRTVLPIAEPIYPPVTELDARKATAPPRFEVKTPEGAPNVLIVLIDDMGFGMPSAFGGPVHMPTAERLAAQGLR